MSVVDVNKIDGIANSDDGKTLFLLIADDLDWNREYDHLIQLQSKVNAYIGFLENQQYKEIYPNQSFNKFFIEIHFMIAPTPACTKFIDVINKQLAPQNIHVIAQESDNQ